MQENITVEFRKSAFKRRLQTIALINNTLVCPNEFLEQCKAPFVKEIEKKLDIEFRLKINGSFKAIYVKKHLDFEEKTTLFAQTNNKSIQKGDNIHNWFENNIKSAILSKIEEFQENGSSWTLEEIIELVINVNVFEVFTGSTYIPTPKFVADKKAVINVQNNDEECFKWAILSALYPATRDAQRVSKYRAYESVLNFDGIDFPVDLKQISQFEKQNVDISVNVYILKKTFNYDKQFLEQKIVPVRLTKNVKTKHVHLLLLREDLKKPNPFNNPVVAYIESMLPGNDDIGTVENFVDEALEEYNEEVGHYCWIKNLSRLISSSYTKTQHKLYVCDRCLCYFASEIKLNQHSTDCFEVNKCKLRIPDDSSKWLSFQNIQRQLEVPFIIYADIESLLTRVNCNDAYDGAPKGAYQQHIPYSIGYYMYCRYDRTKSFYRSRANEDCVEWFADELFKISNDIVEPFLNISKEICISAEEELEYQQSNTCSICNKIIYEDEIKVRDHSHISGKYRGAAHNKCNLLYQESKTIPVVFHNLDYDMHFLIEIMANRFKGKINILPINKEHYISFTKTVVSDPLVDDVRNAIKLRFIDSFKFMSSSLEKLASYLPKENFKITNNEYKAAYSIDKINLLTKKGIFPYDYIDSWDKLKSSELPSKEAFYCKLNDSNISDDDYNFAQAIWNIFEIKDMLEYSELYLKTDILLLADVFENFRDTCLKLYGLDPAHYYTLPGLSWDAMLKYTRIRIELISDIDQLLFVEKGE